MTVNIENLPSVTHLLYTVYKKIAKGAWGQDPPRIATCMFVPPEESSYEVLFPFSLFCILIVLFSFLFIFFQEINALWIGGQGTHWGGSHSSSA